MDLIESIIQSRKVTGEILAQALLGADGISEAGMRDRILANLAAHKEFYPAGWYDPPPGGVAVLFGEKPYARLQFETLRVPEFFPGTARFTQETVAILYASPVDRATGMIGDLGCTIYGGNDWRMQEYLAGTYEAVYKVAKRAEVGMSFSTLYAEAMQLFASSKREIRWMKTTHDPLKVNLGHTLPGSCGEALPLASSFEELKEAIRAKRLYVNKVESFTIPETCAFTVEARLVNPEEPDLPNVQVHFIVTFDRGEKRILANFDSIFKVMGMGYLVGKY